MKCKITRNIWIYTVTLLVCTALMFIAQWFFKLPIVVKTIGSDNMWLPIAADGIIAAVTFIGGNWISNADRLRSQLNDKKGDFEIIRASVERMCIALNIKFKQQYFILSLDPAMNSRDLLHEILIAQQEIEEAQAQLSSVSYLVECQEEYHLFMDACEILIKQFQIVLGGLITIVNNWCDTISKADQIKTVIEFNGEDSKKLEFASLYHSSCKFLENQKTSFMERYDSNKECLERLIRSMRNYADSFLKAEQQIIDRINKKLQ